MSLIVIAIGAAHALPPLIGAMIGSRTSVFVGAAVAGFIAFFYGNTSFIANDLLGAGIGTWLGFSMIDNQLKKMDVSSNIKVKKESSQRGIGIDFVLGILSTVILVIVINFTLKEAQENITVAAENSEIKIENSTGIIGIKTPSDAKNKLEALEKSDNFAHVNVVDGNIFFVNEFGVSKNITSLGIDRDPVLSPDKKSIVFVRFNPNILENSEQGETSAPAIWISDIETNQAKLLLESKSADDPKENLTDFNKFVFSKDGDVIFFMTSAWATSSAVHALDLKTTKTKFITHGNRFRLIPSGQFEGNLIVMQHKYKSTGGSYDHHWIISMEGKEFGLAGETDEDVDFFLRANAN